MGFDKPEQFIDRARDSGEQVGCVGIAEFVRRINVGTYFFAKVSKDIR